jgi:hypothetical protein
MRGRSGGSGSRGYPENIWPQFRHSLASSKRSHDPLPQRGQIGGAVVRLIAQVPLQRGWEVPYTPLASPKGPRALDIVIGDERAANVGNR